MTNYTRLILKYSKLLRHSLISLPHYKPHIYDRYIRNNTLTEFKIHLLQVCFNVFLAACVRRTYVQH